MQAPLMSPFLFSLLFQTKKHPPNRIKRPMNAFMVFSHLKRRKINMETPDRNNSKISIDLGKSWRALSSKQKQVYIDEAGKLAVLHQMEYPDYKYQPKKKARVGGESSSEGAAPSAAASSSRAAKNKSKSKRSSARATATARRKLAASTKPASLDQQVPLSSPDEAPTPSPAALPSPAAIPVSVSQYNSCSSPESTVTDGGSGFFDNNMHTYAVFPTPEEDAALAADEALTMTIQDTPDVGSLLDLPKYKLYTDVSPVDSNAILDLEQNQYGAVDILAGEGGSQSIFDLSTFQQQEQPQPQLQPHEHEQLQQLQQQVQQQELQEQLQQQQPFPGLSWQPEFDMQPVVEQSLVEFI